MRKLAITSLLFLLFCYGREALACTCVPVTENGSSWVRPVERLRLKKYDSDTIFLGSVKSIEEVKRGEDDQAAKLIVTFAVEKVWADSGARAGETRSVITVRTNKFDGLCGIKFELDRRYFVFAKYGETDICTPTDEYDERDAAEYFRVLGKGREPRGPRTAVTPSPTPAQAQVVPTKVMVRAVSRDAKVIGTGVGGARVTIREAATGKVLAEGVQQGGTGSTDLIMRQPRQRGASVYDTEGTAGFLATLALERPTVVEVVAEGPLGATQATQRAAKTVLLVPGEDVLGDGIVLEIHGFIVQLTAPAAPRVRAGQPFEVRATATLTCGCPTEPGGLWDADKMRVVARVLKDGKVVEEAPLRYAGTASTYAGRLSVKTAGEYELEVLALNKAAANFGLARRKLTAAP